MKTAGSAAPARTRFAPSPTGLLHIGNARTALFNWLWARRTGGRFVLRVEDTDPARSKASFEAGLMEDLRWLGLRWDEGPDIGGGSAPYRQSERTRIYGGYAEWLLRHDDAYLCWCSKERLLELRAAQLKAGAPPRYDGRCAQDNVAGVHGTAPAVRFRVPERKVAFTDAAHGRMSFDTKAFGDFVIMGSDGVASYNFAAVIDDALMDITHVIRGDDHLSNTPRQALLYQALGFGMPVFCHVPLVLGADRQPLSKRLEAVSLRALRADGFLPEAVVNAMSRLGWTPGTEGLLTLDELSGVFDLKGLSKSPSVFDMERLRAYNKAAMSGLDAPSLSRLAGISGVPKEAVEAARRNAGTLNELRTLLEPFAGEPAFTEEATAVMDNPSAKAVIRAAMTEVEAAAAIDGSSCGVIMKKVREATGEKGKGLYLPVRCALTGRTEGIELAEVFVLLGKEKLIERLGRFA
ncbi:MAG: glutamate--tRNA ligase [Deltaproteobacteria bacterium]|nr:glutamate--tRNA ligase [Deltaproteobacteria bacterium]